MKRLSVVWYLLLLICFVASIGLVVHHIITATGLGLEAAPSPKAMEGEKETEMSKKKTGAENVRWNLSYLYTGPEDPQLERDLERFERLAAKFSRNYKGKLDTKLAEALRDDANLDELGNKVFIYIYLAHSTDTANNDIKSKMAEIRERFSAASAEHLTFFSLEVAKMDQAAIDAQAAESELLQRHAPYLADIRRFRPHQLSEEVETALGKRAPFGAGSWATFLNEEEAALRFEWEGKQLNLSEALNLLQSTDYETRGKALKMLNDGFKGRFARLSAYALYMAAGSKRVSDKERKYPHSMSSRNMSNKIDDAVVEALHQAVNEVGAPLNQRFYRLKTKLLGLEKMRWADRNAPVRFKESAIVPYDEAKKIVLEAMESFSPVAKKLAKEIFDGQFVDAPTGKHKQNGAFCYHFPGPGGKSYPYIMLNYQGKHSDVTTMAHEFGHGIHGLLAYRAQGTLMWDTPMAYAETASVFNEMVTYDFLQKRLEKDGDDEGRLALAMSFANDIVNTAVRQISFSEFEKMLHNTPNRLSVEQLNDNWMSVTRKFYGNDGDVFTYEDADHLWSYVSHFMRPYYVYSYAFGQLLTASLYAVKDQVPDFENKYLDLLRAGGTKDVVELLKPFGLDPRDPDFWRNGIKVSLGETVELAETLAKRLGKVD